MKAVVAVTKRMFEKDITVRTEPMCPYQDQTTKSKPRLRKEEGNKERGRTYLMEGKNPNVIEGLTSMFRKGKTVEIGLYNNRTNIQKILNKVSPAQTPSLSRRLTATFRLYTICCFGTYLCWW